MEQLKKARLRAVVAAPGFPDWIAPGFGSVWLGNGRAIERINPGTNKPAGYVAAGTQPCEGVATGFGSIWTVDCPRSALIRVDPKSGKVVRRIPLPGTAPDGEGQLTTDTHGVWVPTSNPVTLKSTLVRVDPASNRITARIRVPYDSSGAAAGFGAIWLTSAGSSSVLRIDPAASRVNATIKVRGSPRFIAAGEGGVWSLNQDDGSVSHIDPATNKVVATIPLIVPGSGGCIAAGFGGIWVTMPGTPLSQIDPRSDSIVGQWTGIGGDCITTGFGSVWLVNHDLKNVWRLDPAD
jgi:YVTN family beta-propeller protein